jgi:hypothetical protein
MKRLKICLILIAVGVVGVLSLPLLSTANDDFFDEDHFRAKLKGFGEVPAVSSTGTARFKARINENKTSIQYELTYGDLEGSITAAHIHLGQPDVNGGVAAFLCGGGSKPVCPPSPGTVEGSILATDIVGPEGQGIASGELGELLRAIRSGVTYVNIHTDKHPSGEIRGNIP